MQIIKRIKKVSALLTLFTKREACVYMNEIDNGFEQVATIIENARDNAYRKVNEELILCASKNDEV